MRKEVNAIGFVIVVMTFSIISHLHWDKMSDHPGTSWIDGGRFAAIEKEYDSFFSAHQFAINLWAAVSYLLFNEGNTGVEVGVDNWLFTSEEFNNTPAKSDKVIQNLAHIDSAKKKIERYGSQLFVMIIPAKARVYSEYLIRQLPGHADKRYHVFSQWLKENSIPYLGLLPALKSVTEKNTFIKNDTHWTPLGANLSASHIAKALKQYDIKINWNSVEFETLPKGTRRLFTGDLLNYLPFEPYFSFLTPPKPTIQEYITRRKSELGLFDDINYQAVLIGTSYSVKREWNFAGALQQHTGVDILNLAQEGQGPFKPMNDFLNSAEFIEDKPKLVIWEIPERYLVTTSNNLPKGT